MTTTSNEPPVTDAIGTQSDPPGSDATEVLPSVGTDADDDDVCPPALSDEAVVAVPPRGALATPLLDADKQLPGSPQIASEMRSSVRRPFRHVQMLSPVKGDCLPGLHEFREVLCEDLSAGGVAMLLPHPPDFETCVVAIGKAPHVNYFLARVAHAEHVFRIGCQFLSRLDLDPTTGDLAALPPGGGASKASSPTNEERTAS